MDCEHVVVGHDSRLVLLAPLTLHREAHSSDALLFICCKENRPLTIRTNILSWTGYQAISAPVKETIVQE